MKKQKKLIALILLCCILVSQSTTVRADVMCSAWEENARAGLKCESFGCGFLWLKDTSYYISEQSRSCLYDVGDGYGHYVHTEYRTLTIKDGCCYYY
jgi:hypothetical protein